MALLMHTASESTSHHRVMTKKRMETPKRPRPTTVKPMIEPPVKATRNALLRWSFAPSFLRAAWVVLTLASVATLMPIQPAWADSMAPTMKQIAVFSPSTTSAPSTRMPRRTKRTMATTVTNPARYLYSVFRKALHPRRATRKPLVSKTGEVETALASTAGAAGMKGGGGLAAIAIAATYMAPS